MSPLDAKTLSALHHIEAGSPLAALLTTNAIQNFAKTQLPQTAHRIEVVKAWEVELDGRNVLEIGCGQGDASVVLASAVGQGRVTAWDPADPEYGSPLTVGQAQVNLKSKPQLDNLTFRLTCPLNDLLNADYHVAVLLHCIYYFPSTEALSDTFRALHPRVDTLCISEYSLRSSMSSQHPHVLAVLAQQALETIKPIGESQSNVQTVLSPRAIVALAGKSGFHLVRERIITPDASLQDGRWEVGTVYSSQWMEDVDAVLNEVGGDASRQRAWLAATRDSTVAAVDRLADENTTERKAMDRVRTMDVWCGVFRRTLED